jgi:asparaginyl-tRNA synthetase
MDPHQRFMSSSHVIDISNPSIASLLARPPRGEEKQSERITVTGFIRTVRHQKLRSFVEIGDGSTVESLQAVLEPGQAKG